MTEERLNSLETWLGYGDGALQIVNKEMVQELIDEVRFLQAALADARAELEPRLKPNCVVPDGFVEPTIIR